MALYISLVPFSYVQGSTVVDVLQAGRLIELTQEQAALYPEQVAYFGSGSNYLAPQITMLAYDSTLVFPNVGSKFHVYLDQSTGRLWQWSDTTQEYTLVSVITPVTPPDIVGVTDTGEALITAADPEDARDTLQVLGFLQAAKDPDQLIVGSITLDGDDLTVTAAVAWPDGTPGVLTITSRDSNGAVLSYNITYGSPVSKTFTQPAITRNANGAATNVPPIVES